MESYLNYFSQKIIDNDYISIDINWFSSWLFLIPSIFEFNYNYFPRVFYFILIPSLINHAHIKKYDNYINPIEKIFIYTTGAISFIERTYNALFYGFQIYDLIIYPGTFIVLYIYFIAKLSNNYKYSNLYHLIVHIIGVIISLSAYMTYLPIS
jgi:hypothetical protein